MRRVALFAATLTLGSVLIFQGAGPDTATARPSSKSLHTEYILALGDSAPIWNGTESYPNLITRYYRASGLRLKLVKMACSDETSSSMLSGSTCAPGGSQQNEAVAFLQQHRGAVELVTLDIGGNDIVFCGGPTGLDAACVQRAMTQVRGNLVTILNGLRSAAGPTTRIGGTTYYDPLLGDWLAGGVVRRVALGTVPVLVQFNALLTDVYTQWGATVADVQGAFASTDLTDNVSSRWGVIPVAVERVCTLLNIRCRVNKVERFGSDPNEAGAIVIASAFENSIGSL